MWLGGSVTVVAIAVYAALRSATCRRPVMYAVRDRVHRRWRRSAADRPAALRQVAADQRRDRADRAAGLLHRQRRPLRRAARRARHRGWATSPRRPRCSSPSCRSCCTRSSASSCRRPRRRRWSTRAGTSRSRSRRAGFGQALMYADADPGRADRAARRAAHLAARPDRRDEDRLHRLRRLGRRRRRGRRSPAPGPVLGWVGAFVFIWVLFASGTAWIMGAGRAQAAACLDGAGPAVLGRISAAHRRAGGHGPASPARCR